MFHYFARESAEKCPPLSGTENNNISNRLWNVKLKQLLPFEITTEKKEGLLTQAGGVRHTTMHLLRVSRKLNTFSFVKRLDLL